jgi:ubiquinone biosynthesis protein COQ4
MKTRDDMPMRRRREWRRAWAALQHLIADPERTDSVFEIIDALSGASFERSFKRFRAHPQGARLLAARPDLLAALRDRAALRELPAGSFGRAYAEFMDAAQLDPQGLIEADQAAEARHPRQEPIDADRQYYGERLRDMHDLWHVLTGYGRDEAGEAANLAFTHAQIPNFGVALIVLAAAVIGTTEPSLAWPRYLYRAWRRGRAASLLSVAAYEDLLPLPLEEVRRHLAISPVELAHPQGIIVATKDDLLAA